MQGHAVTRNPGQGQSLARRQTQPCEMVSNPQVPEISIPKSIIEFFVKQDRVFPHLRLHNYSAACPVAEIGLGQGAARTANFINKRAGRESCQSARSIFRSKP